MKTQDTLAWDLISAWPSLFCAQALGPADACIRRYECGRTCLPEVGPIPPPRPHQQVVPSATALLTGPALPALSSCWELGAPRLSTLILCSSRGCSVVIKLHYRYACVKPAGRSPGPPFLQFELWPQSHKLGLGPGALNLLQHCADSAFRPEAEETPLGASHQWVPAPQRAGQTSPGRRVLPSPSVTIRVGFHLETATRHLPNPGASPVSWPELNHSGSSLISTFFPFVSALNSNQRPPVR